jgi:hypothetical protein
MYGKPRGVIIITSEDSWEMTVKPRLIAADADLARIFHVRPALQDEQRPYVLLPKDLKLLEQGIHEHDIGLVILDPLLSSLDPDLDDYRSKQVRTALEPVAGMAGRTGCIVLAIAHFNKKTECTGIMQLISGAAAFGHLVRAAFGFVLKDDAIGVFSQAKNNLGRMDLPSWKYKIESADVVTDDGETAYVSRFAFTGDDSEETVIDVLATKGDGKTTNAARELAQRALLRVLEANGPTTWETLVALANESITASEITLRRARNDLRRDGTIDKRKDGDGRWLWRILAEKEVDDDDSI